MATNKYANAKIYRIVSNVTGEQYYGSTTEPTLARRLAKHRNSYNLYKFGKSPYYSSFKILETDDYDIVLVENYSCNSKDELHTRERFYIENNECVNKNIPNKMNDVGKNEYGKLYKRENKQSIKQYNSDYYSINKHQILKEAMKPIFCDACNKTISNSNMSKHIKTKRHDLNEKLKQLKNI